MAGHRPSRLCPHRWCGSVHALGGVFALVSVVPMLFGGFAALGALCVGVLVLLAVQRLVHPRGMRELLFEEGVGRRVGAVLVERKGWSRVAVAADFALVITAGFSAWDGVAHPDASVAATIVGAVDPVGLLARAAVAWFVYFAHKKATEPARPQRVAVPASSSA